MMKDDARFLITSCNWTQDELIKEFEPREFALKLKCLSGHWNPKFSSVFKYHSHIKYPSFQFGGVKGQTIW
jgi:hypothetical protein